MKISHRKITAATNICASFQLSDDVTILDVVPNGLVDRARPNEVYYKVKLNKPRHDDYMIFEDSDMVKVSTCVNVATSIVRIPTLLDKYFRIISDAELE